MHTGVRTLVRKTIHRIRNAPQLLGGINPHSFPDKPIRSMQIEAKLKKLQVELQKRHISYSLGSLLTLPHPQATAIYKRFIDYNPGNLGAWSDDASTAYASAQFEYEVIHKLIDLYHGDHHKLGGYITSGGSEGNIFSVWLGRTYFQKYYKTDQICLLMTSLTHYSVKKAGFLSHISLHITPLDTVAWNIDIQGFRLKVRLLYAQGYRGFIVPLTLGYSSTGTSDDILAVTRAAGDCEKELKGVKFFFWIDAAFNGLTSPFLDKDFFPFSSPAIRAFVVDFHKFGQVPYPAGVILYDKSLKHLIEQPIDYLLETDTTLLGSRSGIPAVSIWVMIHTLGASGFQHIAEKQKRNKEYLITHLKILFQKVEIISHQNSLSCGVIFHNLKNNRLPTWIENKYSLHLGSMSLQFVPDDAVVKRVYKIYFLPHLHPRVIKEFIRDCKQVG